MTRPAPTDSAAAFRSAAAAPASAIPPGASAGLPGPESAPHTGPGTSPAAVAIPRSQAAAGDPTSSAVALQLALGTAADKNPPGAGRRRASQRAAPGGSNSPAGPAALPGENPGPGRRDEGPQRPGQGAIAAAMSETQLEQAIRRIIKDLGLLAYHTFDSRRSAGGFPDWVIVGPGGVLFRELKTERGKVTDAQAQWLRALVHAGQDACVWRPRDLISGLIARRLAKLAGMEAA